MAYAETTPSVVSIDGLISRYASEFHVSEKKMRLTIQCESNFDIGAFNQSDPQGGAKGLAQFLQPTFDKYAPLAGVQNGDPYNPEDAIHVMSYMWSIGESRQWSCKKLIDAGKYP